MDGYRQLGFEFEHIADIKNQIIASIKNLAGTGENKATTNDIEMLRATLYEFSELEFDDSERQEIFQEMLNRFKDQTKLPSLPRALYFSRFGDLVETLDYLLNPTAAQVNEFCKVTQEAMEKATKLLTTNKVNEDAPIIISELDTLIDKFHCPSASPG
ncbi:MAG: hypothetical protein ACFCVA_04345 [Gammaproteobacteria bacterium]